MSTFRISIDLKDLPDDLQARLLELPIAIRRAMRSGTAFGRALLTKKSPTDQGQLRDAWKTIDSAGAMTGRTIELVNEAPHAGIVERGARPHKVSAAGIAAIAQWVWRNRQNFNLGRVSGPVQRGKGAAGGGRKALQRTSELDQCKAIAYAIAWKIRHHGQKPTWFVRDSMPRISSVTRREVVREVERLAGTRFR